MEQLMYGSSHTHFEDLFDTANDKKKMVCEFVSLGAKRVALTGHGTMFAYEDLKELVAMLKETKQAPEDFEIVPGVEVYFEDEARHMVLVAEDYEGYQQICRVVTDSAKNTKSSKSSSEDQEYLTPIVTMENLEKNIGSNSGHVYMTSACIGGVFAKPLGLDEEPFIKEMDKHEKKYQDILRKSIEASAIISEWEKITKDPANKKLLKKENEALSKALEEGDQEAAAPYLQRQKNYENMIAYKEENKKAVDQAKRVMKSLENAEITGQQIEMDYQAFLDDYPKRFEEAKELYFKLESVFGKDNIYFELQNHGIPVEKKCFNNVIDLAYEVGNPNFIASNDVHIGDRKGSETWEQSVLKRRVEMFNRFKNIPKREDEEEYGIKTDSELKEELLKIVEPHKDKDGVTHRPEEIVDNAIGNIRKALEPCKVVFPKIGLNLDKGETNFYPKFCEDEVAEFKRAVEEGIKKKFPKGLPEGYRERIDYEMDIICSMGYAGYHLIVKDYIEYGRLLGCLRTEEEINNAPLSIEGLNQYIDDNHIPRVGMGVGPGRGSAAGCECAYLIGITDVDPIPYGLMFERFLNPSRHSMPDIDTDFKDDIRERLYEYIKARYGDECVSKVCTKAEAHGKKAGDISRSYLATLEGEGKTDAEKTALKSQYIQANKRVSAMIDKYMKENGLNTTKVESGTIAAKALFEERQKNPIENDEEFRKEQAILEMIGKIAGIPSNISMHACACLISGTPLSDVIPLAWNDAKQKMTTQCLYPQAENLGLLKMDLLNIKNLTVITKVMQDVRESGIEDDKLLTPEGIGEMLQDPKIFKEIFSKGRTKGVFQFESEGMTKMLKDFEPECFDDIIILVAAYRPGPIDFIPEIIQEKWWRKLGENSPLGKPNHRIKIENEKLKEILAPTYGVPIYQEQIMKIVQELAGYNMADADNVRKYMSKKKTALLEKERGFFVYGSEHVIKEAKAKLEYLRSIQNPTDEDIKEANVLEAEIQKMPTYIKGCVPNGICSAKEANDLFDAMMEFGKYAFNKSHALCYAQVAMYTAYQKLYFPELFYKHTLSNETKDGPDPKTKKMATEKYEEEMKTFGINLLPPDPNVSKADYEIENGNIRTGFGCIKGSSYVNYQNADNVLMFIAKNPDISLTAVTKFAKLGMFKKIYPTNKHTYEIERVNGNRDKIVKWIDENGEDVKSYGKISRDVLEHKSEIESIKKSLENPSISNVEKIELKDKLNVLNNEIETLTPMIANFRETFMSMMKNDAPYPERPKKDMINDRLFEYENIGIAFSAKEDIEMLKKYSTNNTIASIEAKRDTSLTKTAPTAKIAATVVSKKEKKAGSNGPSYRITLMDKNGDTLECGYWDSNDPTADITCGYFTIKYGTYSTIEKGGVVPFNNELQKVTTNENDFKDDKEVKQVINPLTNKPIYYQDLDDVDNEIDEKE